MNESESIGARIVRARAAKGISQAELAQRADVAATQVARWERGKAVPRPETLHKLALLLDVSPRWLESGEGALNEHEYPSELPLGEKEVIANLSDEELRLLRKRASESGRTLGDEMAAIADEFLARWQRQPAPPGWMKLEISERLQDRLAAAADKNGRSLSEEISARLSLSLDADDIAEEAPLRERPLPEGAVIDHGVQVWAQRLLKPGNRHELEALLATIQAMVKSSM
ncbi:helix-turn-helix transcriptional regulator [Burkholderia cenocepacia]|uniref:helix-turn-helix domain-containing protein n=1 Tax=Burkholderia cenocepacia TaxID=95486 RepID=UPI002654E71A|nr:helix-turn-helix transcriptional regulator [Burkholderia cenocepacia]MDN7825120.1 helix-turn-helix transcriptional regulator [Burkholderia cenocepacia]